MAEVIAGRSDLPRTKMPVPQASEEGYFAKVVGGDWTAMPADPEGVTAAGAAAADDIGAATGATTTAKIKSLVAAASAANDGVVELATAAEIVTGTDTGRAVTPGDLKSALALDGMWLTKRVKAPDAVALTYKSDFMASVDSWAITGGFEGQTVQTYSGGVLRATVQAAATYIALQRIISSATGKNVLIRLRASTTMALAIKSSSDTIKDVLITTEESVYLISTVMTSDTLVVYGSGRSASDWLEIVDVRVGTLAVLATFPYNAGSIPEEGAKIVGQLADTAGVGKQATVTITATSIAENDYIAFGGRTYTWKSAIPSDGDIYIDNLENSLNRFVACVNGTDSFGGTVNPYSTVHPLVTAYHAPGSQVVTLTAIRKGAVGNLIDIAKSGSNITLSGSSLSGGIDDVGMKTLIQIQDRIAGSGTRPAAAKVELTSTALIGYETTVDVASGGTFTLPSGGTWIWNVYGYGATISSAKRGSSAGGTTLTVAGANASVGYRRYA